VIEGDGSKPKQQPIVNQKHVYLCDPALSPGLHNQESCGHVGDSLNLTRMTPSRHERRNFAVTHNAALAQRQWAKGR
jgi:hypothetical protein